MSEAVVTVRDLVVSYGERRVLEGVSAEMRRGEISVILGGSGCGAGPACSSRPGRC